MHDNICIVYDYTHLNAERIFRTQIDGSPPPLPLPPSPPIHDCHSYYALFFQRKNTFVVAVGLA